MAHGTVDDSARAAALGAALVPDGMLDLNRLRTFVPEQGAGAAAVGLDGVLRITHRAVGAASGAPGKSDALLHLPLPARRQLEALAPALTGQQLTGEDAVEALHAAHRVTARVAEARLHAARELTARTATESLVLKNVTTPEELSKTAFERWRARSKSVAAAELQALTGLGRGAAREVVAVANAPEVCQVPVRQGLTAGIAGWDLVLAWWRRCARLPHEDTAVVARSLFGTDIPPEQAACERLTPEGELSTTPWAKKQFFDALEREVRLLEGTDPAGQEAQRQAQHRSRDAYAVVDDDGTAQLVVKGDVVSITGCIQRLQVLARKARDAGDPRSVSNLRSDIARALLVHGTLPLPDLGEDPNVVTPEDIGRLVDVLAGHPGGEVQVIVPWDVLTGHAALVNPYPGSGAYADVQEPDGPRGPRVLEGVGRVLGRFPAFLSGAQVRVLAGRPGTTLYRLLTDPADGRCLERSLTRYAPDAAMRAQLRAADVMSRAPGSTVPAGQCDLDHVEEYLLGGRTSQTNLQAVDRPWHALKTEKFWDAAIDASRTITWESFWGRLYRTRPHDYRQYLTRARPEEQRHLASLLVYAALAHRAPGARLEADDDDPDSDQSILGLHDALWIRHTTSSGRRTTGPRPGTPTPEDLIAHDPGAVLAHADWTTFGDASRAPHGGDDEGEDAGVLDEDPPAPEPAPPPPF